MMMMKYLRGRWALLAIVLAIGLGYGAGSVLADRHDDVGTLVLTPMETIIEEHFQVEVREDGVFVVPGAENTFRQELRILGGEGMVRKGTLTGDSTVFVSGRGKGHTHRGHVTVLK